MENMESRRHEDGFIDCDLIELKQQSSQHLSNVFIHGVTPTNKEILFNPSECQIHTIKKYSNNASSFGQNIDIISQTDMDNFIKKPLPKNKNSNDRWNFQQSYHEVLTLLKNKLKLRYLYYILLCSLISSVIIGIVAYGMRLHNVNEDGHHNNFSNIKLMISRARINKMIVSNIEDKNNTDASIESTTESQRNAGDTISMETTSKSNMGRDSTTIGQFLKVSPTFPSLHNNITSNGITIIKPAIHDNNCSSTSLDFCRGILNYDLTYPNAKNNLDEITFKDIDTLFKSNCSVRAIEFLCTILEPECRPEHIGILPPCRRICKAILEACALVINSIDTLISIFDCNIYPDSNDWNQCDEPTTRRNYCYKQEFACADRSCIPLQWQCDKIKDCANGEDEDGCIICVHPDDFRCHSNDKCIPEYKRCNQHIDCIDKSDEENCHEYDDNSKNINIKENSNNLNTRIYPYASYILPNQSNKISNDFMTSFRGIDIESHKNILDLFIFNKTFQQTSKTDKGNDSSSLANYRDSKEIMITSDSENTLKYERINFTRRSNKYTTPLKRINLPLNTTTHESVKNFDDGCVSHQLRCVSGKCINVDQLCDKIVDCPDGFDELLCVYKESRHHEIKNVQHIH